MPHRTRRLVLMTLALSAACSGSDGPTDPDETLIGTWNVTHLAVLGSNLISLGMTATVAFTAQDTYTFTVTGDLTGICGAPVTSCTQTGTWSATSSQLTLDSSVADPVTFSYSITGSTMTWTGALQGIPATVTLVKQ